jgi:hypothetical protein
LKNLSSPTGFFFIQRFKMLSRFFFAMALLFALLFLGAAAMPKEVLATVSLVFFLKKNLLLQHTNLFIP